jgi:hypothetical protein
MTTDIARESRKIDVRILSIRASVFDLWAPPIRLYLRPESGCYRADSEIKRVGNGRREFVGQVAGGFDLGLPGSYLTWVTTGTDCDF